MIKKLKYILYWCMCLSNMAIAQIVPLQQGKPLIKNYNHKEYKSHPQVWAMVQDQRGLMYFGTDTGLLEYDGVTWRTIATPNNKRVRSMTVGKDGTVYLGLSGDFGYLAPNSQGYLAYVSLLPTVAKDKRNFSDVWRTIVAKNKVYFVTMTKTFCYQQKQLINIIEVPKQSWFFLGFDVHDTWYQPRRSLGINVLKKGNLQLIKGSDAVGQAQVFSMLPYSKQEVLIYEAQSGFWLYNKHNATFHKFKSALDQDTRRHSIYCGTALPNGLFAFGTRTHGIIIINKAGKLVNVIDRTRGLCNNTVWSIYYQPGTQNIWAGTDNGIAKVMYDLPILQFDESNGLEGSIHSLCRFEQKLYVSTTVGVFRLDSQGFSKIKGISGQTLKFTPYQIPQTDKTQLLVGNMKGVYVIKGDTSQLLLHEQVAIKFLPDLKNINRAYVGVLDGISIKKYQQGKWLRKIVRLKGLKDPPEKILQDQDHRVWVTTQYKGVGLIENDQVTMFDSTAGLFHQGQDLGVLLFNNKTYFNTAKGTYVFDPARRHFVPDNSIAQYLGYATVAVPQTDSTHSFWLAKDQRNLENYIILKKQGNRFVQDSLTLKSLYPQKITNVYIEPNGVYWLATDEGLVRYEGNQTIRKPQKFKVKIRKVTTNGDSLLYAGYRQETSLPVLSYAQNSVNFNYAALYFNFTKQNEYSYRLKGYDKQWSKWTKDTKKEYTNLPEGNYVFWVKARNIYGQESNIAKYSFKVLPPWHRTWWARTLYVVSALITLYGGIKIYTLRLQRQKAILERKVLVRTREVVEQKEKIEIQNDVLQQKSEEIIAQNDALKQKSEELLRQSEEIMAQRDAIEATNQTLNLQNHQITQSIRSAETIQAAILPFDNRLKTLFDDHFVLFRPRDVVSGDFYYLEQVGEATILAAIDCTGHGVPGAFMSLIGYALLNEIIYAQGKTLPAEILETLREEVRHALKQDQTKHQHGMDVAMVSISPFDNDEVKVVFAGAKRPLWYMLPNGEALQIVKGSSVSIGIEYRQKREIVNNVLTLPKGSVLYLSSDGFADQNNEQRKKFGAKNLQNLLVQNYARPMHEQQTLLEQALDKFMADTEQRDDILLMGIRL